MKDLFCAKEQTMTPHMGAVDSNGEYVFTCSTEGCSAFVKFPADTTPEKLDELIAVEAEANAGQVSVEAQEATLSVMLGETNPEVIVDEEPEEVPEE